MGFLALYVDDMAVVGEHDVVTALFGSHPGGVEVLSS